MLLKSDSVSLQSILLMRDPIDETVPVPDEQLARLSWGRVVSSQQVNDNELHAMILELQSDDAAHTWRWLSAEGSGNLSKRLLEFENERRESIILYYYGEDLLGQRHLFGAVALAERVSKDFPYTGFPVIGRMYIRNQYRENKLGSYLSVYQILFCFRIFEEKLMGIHLGTSSPQIFTLLQRVETYGEKFRYVGNKKLEGKDAHLVKAFFLPTKKFLQPLTRLSDNLIQKSEEGQELAGLIQAFIENQVDETFFYKIKYSSADIENKTGFSSQENLSFKQLITLLSTIPVMEISDVASSGHRP